ncbi:MAG: SCO family protein [Saprospiraceae bacterium]
MKYILFILVIVLQISCSTEAPDNKLPILGNKDFVDGDTIYHTIPDFSFIDQDSQIITNKTFEGQAYVVDFFFISCPSICPKTTKQMLRIHDRFKNTDGISLVAHSIDPKRDTVAALKKYAHNLDVSSKKWHFLTGDKDELLDIADDYFNSAFEDADAPGGFDHSGRFILVDKNRHIRSFCDGTDPGDVDRFMEDIQKLLDEDKNTRK